MNASMIQFQGKRLPPVTYQARIWIATVGYNAGYKLRANDNDEDDSV